MNLNVQLIKKAIIFGASGGIGHALAKLLLSQNKNLTLFLHHRHASPPSHLSELKLRFGKRVHLISSSLKDCELEKIAHQMESDEQEIDLLINAIGFLHDNHYGPEKSLRDIDEEHFAKSFYINATVSAVIAKHFIPLFQRKSPGAFVCISAKVGSISDNRMGGWYSYRASKAALNMIIKNIAIELERKKSLTKVLSIHPGTTDTDLSEPFTKNTPYKLHKPIETAENILNVIFNPQTQSGCFYSWDGSEILW